MYGICTLQFDLKKISRLTENKSRNTRTAGVPDTVRLPVENKRKNTILLTQEMQLWMHKLCWDRVPSLKEVDAKKSWRSLMMGASEGNKRTARAFTNFTGSNTNRDYVNNTNKGEEPIRMDFILTGGAFIKLIGDDARNRIKGEDCWMVAAIDPKSDFTQYTPQTHPWLFFYPTISVRKPIVDSKGKFLGKYLEYISEPFPQYDAKSVIPIWAQPGENYVFVPKSRVTIADQPKTPFVQSVVKYNMTPFYENPYRGIKIEEASE